MKNVFKLITGILCFILFAKQGKAQADIAGLTGHTGTTSTYYCGWDNTTAFDLNIEHQGTYNINFLTGGTQRMIILGTGAAKPGFVGIGTAAPARHLEILDADSLQLRLTQTAGTAYTDFNNTGHIGLQMHQSAGLFSIFSTIALHPSYIKVAIGTQASDASTWNLTIHSDDAVSVTTQYTNNATGTSILSGFVTGIYSTGDAAIQQNENKNIRVSTPTLSALFTEGGALTNGTDAGDGLRIADAFTGGPGNLDMWAGAYGTSNTHIQFGQSGNIDGQNSRFEISGHFNGLWLNSQYTTAGVANTYFNLDGTEVGRIQNSFTSGDVGFWGIGEGFATSPPLVTLDVHGQEDLETVNNQDSLTKVLVWDHANNNNIKWRSASTLGINSCTLISTDVGYIPRYDGFGPPHICKSIIFDNGLNNVGIGWGTSPGTSSRLDVNGGDSPDNETLGIHSQATNSTTSTRCAGISSESFGGPNTIWSYGLECHSYGSASTSAGLYGLGENGTISAVSTNTAIGVQGLGRYSKTVYGGFFEGQGTSPTMAANSVSYGIYAQAESAQTNYAGYFSGDVTYTGKLSGTSDSILKVDVQKFTGDSALFYLRNLKPKTFQFDNEDYGFMNLPTNWQYGLIAQDVNRVLPPLVQQNFLPAKYDSTGAIINDSVSYLSLNYIGLIPILVAGVKQLDSLQNALPNQVNNALSADSTTHKLQWGGSPLKHNTEIPMVDTTGGIDSVYNVYFSGQNNGTIPYRGNVGIGYSNGSYLNAKLDVFDSIINNNATAAGAFTLSGTAPSYSGYTTLNSVNYVSGSAENNAAYFSAANGEQNIGLISYGSGDDESFNTGVIAMAPGGYYATGIQAGAESSSSSYGGWLWASNGAYSNIGVYGQVYPVSGAFNAAVMGEVSGGSDYAGYFQGDVYTTGSYLPSDEKLKNNIQDVSNGTALNIIGQLKPKTYTYNVQQYPNMALPSGQQYGLISEDVEQVLPTLIKDSKTPPKLDSTGKVINPSIEFKALNYTALVPILIAATKQLDSTNAAQQTKIDSLQAQLAQINTALQQLQNCCAQSMGNTQNGDRQESVVLTNTNAIILNENAPNPFAEQTTITYTIPESVNNAQLIFSDISGNVIKTVQIQTRGAGSLLVYASNLSSGLYTYSLIADGKLIDTKKMTIQK